MPLQSSKLFCQLNLIFLKQRKGEEIQVKEITHVHVHSTHILHATKSTVSSMLYIHVRATYMSCSTCTQHTHTACYQVQRHVLYVVDRIMLHTCTCTGCTCSTCTQYTHTTCYQAPQYVSCMLCALHIYVHVYHTTGNPCKS